MPVTSFALLLCSVVLAAIVTVWAMTAWGPLAVLAILSVCAALGWWGFAHVPHDDSRT